MKKSLLAFGLFAFILFTASDCEDANNNKTAITEQRLTERNQADLLNVQPPPKISWSLERDNLIKRFKLMNDRSIMFYMYIFIEGVADPIGYYQVNKVSSVNSQLTATQQMVNDPNGNRSAGSCVLESPAEDGSYGTNGEGVFGFTPEDIYIEHNMRYIVSTLPLHFREAVQRLVIIDVKTQEQLTKMMDKIN